MIADVRAALAATSDPAARLEAGLRAFVEAMLRDERGARIVYLETVGVSPELEAMRREIRHAYVELIAGEAGRLPRIGSWSPTARHDLAVALMGAADGLIVDWLSSERRRARTEIVDMMLVLFGPTIG